MSITDIEQHNDDNINNARDQGCFLKKKYNILHTDGTSDTLHISADMMKMHKMSFIYNALEKGWTIRKMGRYYVFKKKHGGTEEVFLDSYLADFISENIN